LFRAAVKAVTRRDPEARSPPKSRRRSGEKAGGIPILLRRFSRAARPAACGRYAALQPIREGGIPEDVPHVESSWDVFDISSLAYEHGIDNQSFAAFDTRSDHLSPGL
jgi:hypothetical protein